MRNSKIINDKSNLIKDSMLTIKIPKNSSAEYRGNKTNCAKS